MSRQRSDDQRHREYVQLGLAALKLPAGLLSGSVGLLNDATDTLLDGISSLLVYAGLRFDRERTVNVVLGGDSWN